MAQPGSGNTISQLLKAVNLIRKRNLLMRFFISILFATSLCFSCTSDNSTRQTAKPAMDSLDSNTKDKDKDGLIYSGEKESNEATSLITNITEKNGQVFIDADYIQRLDGERAIEEAKKRGDADTTVIDGKMEIGVVDDYYTINDNPKIRKLPLDPDVKFELIINPDRYDGKVDNSLQGLKLIYKETPFILTIKKGKVIKVHEIFVP